MSNAGKTITREEAIDLLKDIKFSSSDYPRDVEALEMALEALKEPKARCLSCDFLKSCMHAWDIDCGCEFFKVNGVHPREGEE